ncbi:polysaccharide biosynthesis/export family protein [Taklimakanibacter lacteus]|uniref:polysaccharide biosynthesis/export family protein n=1 Tax=Taklimakanibacter lacteus TaxID=2268456 RepID=UPI0013C4A383
MRFIILAVLPFFLSACAETWDADPPTAATGGMGVMADGTVAQGPGAVASVTELASSTPEGIQPPYGAAGSAAAYEYDTGYRIGAGDRLTIRVAGEADLTNDYLVDGSGNISMPYIKTTYVGGMSAPEVEKLVATRLRNGFLRNPSVSVQVTTLRPFFILGEVNTAGSFPYQPGMTVQNAIAIAGGYSPRAHQGPVLITRKNVEGTETHKAPVTTQVYPGDVIYVRERWF